MAQANWNKPTEPFHVIDNIYYVGTEGLGAYLFTGPEGHVLLDGATPEGADVIEANIAKLGFKLSDVKVLLNSHAHYDHSGGLAQLKQESGASSHAMEGDVSALEGGFYLGSEDVKAMNAPPVKVDRVLKEGEQVKLAGIDLIAHLTPGHSRGCTAGARRRARRQDLRSAGVLLGDGGGQPHHAAAAICGHRGGLSLDLREGEGDEGGYPPRPASGVLRPAAEGGEGENGQVANFFVDPAAFAPYIARLEDAFETTLKQRTAAKP